MPVAPVTPAPYRGRGRQPDGRKEVIHIDTATVVALVLGTATLVVAIIGLVVKIIELRATRPSWGPPALERRGVLKQFEPRTLERPGLRM